MGGIRKIRKKYFTPSHPWVMSKIEEERELTTTYGFRNKKEIWKMSSKLKKFSDQAKSLIVARSKQSEVERDQLLAKLQKMGLIPQTAKLDEVLSLKLKDYLERRLQTLVFKKGLSRSVLQARQMITHGHIKVNGKVITSPSYLVSVAEESNITFSEFSKFNDSMHPERKEVIKSAKAVAKEEAKASAAAANASRKGKPFTGGKKPRFNKSEHKSNDNSKKPVAASKPAKSKGKE